MRRVLNYAAQLELLKRNPLIGVKGLKNDSRKSIWLRTPEIDRLLNCCDPWLRDLMEFRVLTGARPSEAMIFGERNVDLHRQEFWLCTLKKRTPGEHRRYFSIPGQGSRFSKLLARLNPHPKTGLYFGRSDGEPHKLITVEHAFGRARKLAGLDHVTSYDLRGTFAMHRAMVVKGFRQLQTEMGHSNPNSIQSYLDEAARFGPEESIFYEGEKNGAESGEASLRKSPKAMPEV